MRSRIGDAHGLACKRGQADTTMWRSVWDNNNYCQRHLIARGKVIGLTGSRSLARNDLYLARNDLYLARV